ncbi:hypothetical protein JCM11641_006878 [Rhodosporidiobolus odoratus]
MPFFLQNVAVAGGTGNIGSFLVSSLASAGFTVTVLSRSSSTKANLPAGVKVKEVDYASSESLQSALQGIDVVVSATQGYDVQAEVAKAAKTVGVKLFVPSEFGNPSTDFTPTDHPALYGKKKSQELLKELSLPALLVFTGPFPDFIFVPFFGFDFASRKVNLIGTGNTPISFTTRSDIGPFLAHYLSTLTSTSDLRPHPSLPFSASKAIVRRSSKPSLFGRNITPALKSKSAILLWKRRRRRPRTLEEIL